MISIHRHAKKLEIEFGPHPQLRQEQYAAVIDPQDGELMGYVQFFLDGGSDEIGTVYAPRSMRRWALVLPLSTCSLEEAKRRKPSDEIDLEVLMEDQLTKAKMHGLGQLFHCRLLNGGFAPPLLRSSVPLLLLLSQPSYAKLRRLLRPGE